MRATSRNSLFFTKTGFLLFMCCQPYGLAYAEQGLSVSASHDQSNNNLNIGVIDPLSKSENRIKTDSLFANYELGDASALFMGFSKVASVTEDFSGAVATTDVDSLTLGYRWLEWQ